jgi:two-component system heavy metal sensor histidine kinase CusS
MSSKSTLDASRLKDPAPLSRSWSLAFRLTIWYSVSAFVLILGATGFLYWALTTNLDREDDQFLLDRIGVLRTILREHPNDLAMLKSEIERESASRQYGQLYLRILSASGDLRLETEGMSSYLPPDGFQSVWEKTRAEQRGAEIETDHGKSFRILADMVESPHSQSQPEQIQVALDRTYEEALLAGYRRYLWLALGLAVILCALTGYQIARRGLNPLAKITATTRRIRSTNLQERIAVAGLPKELFELAVKFNEMLGRLEESFQRLAQFSADIAHELRTPVNNLKGEAEVALTRPRSPEEYRETLGSCLEECGRLSRMIDGLLFLARAENPQAQIEKTRLDLGKELIAVADFYEPAATEAGVTMTVKSGDRTIADVDRALLQRAVGNLVANSLAHTGAGGAVTLSASTNGASVCISVSDTGRGIAKANLPYVFDRFYRADLARAAGSENSGLGLAIVKSIAALHRGSVSMESEEGRGTTVRLVFPRTQERRERGEEPSA